MVTTGPGSPHGQGDINNSWAECGNWDHNSEAPSAPREVGGEEREELENWGQRTCAEGAGVRVRSGLRPFPGTGWPWAVLAVETHD